MKMVRMEVGALGVMGNKDREGGFGSVILPYTPIYVIRYILKKRYIVN